MARSRLLLMVIIAIVSMILAVFFDHLYPSMIAKAQKSGDIFRLLNTYIFLVSLSRFFMGISIGIISIPVVVFIVAPLFGFEVSIEKKLRVSNIVILSRRPKLSFLSVFLYSYTLFGPAIILVRIMTTLGSKDMITYYLAAGGIMLSAMPYLLVFLIAPCIIRDLSSVRSFKDNLTMSYPSKLLQLILLIIVGMGSIAALAPMYWELLSIVKNPDMALKLFLYAIAMGYVPAFCMVCGYMLGALVVSKPYFGKSIEKFEGIVSKIGKVSVIVLEQRKVDAS
ncbi:MAG: hypothetical protein Q6363_000225 [Candidatus Njordarchaeota archaeon]